MADRTIGNNRLIEGLKLDQIPDSDLTGDALKLMRVKITEDGYELVPLSDIGVTEFINLDDTPLNYSLQGGKALFVKTTEDGVEFKTIVEKATKTVTFVVTANFASGEVIDITDGTGSISGTSTRIIGDTGAITSLGVDANTFNVDASLVVTDNKTTALKGNDVIFDSATTFHFTRPLLIGEWFIIQDGETSGGGALGDTTIDGDLTVTGNITKSGSTVGKVVILVDDSASSSTINLPTAVGLLNQSFTYIRTDTSLNTTTLNPSGAETINNNASFVFGKGESVTIISDNSNWFIY